MSETIEIHPDSEYSDAFIVSKGPAAGIALANRTNKIKKNNFEVISEEELYEGSTWEALLFVVHDKITEAKIILDEEDMAGEVTLADPFAFNSVPKGLFDYLVSFKKVVFVDEQIESSSLGRLLATKFYSHSPKTGIKNLALNEDFMFESPGRDRPTEPAEIDKNRIISAVRA